MRSARSSASRTEGSSSTTRMRTLPMVGSQPERPLRGFLEPGIQREPAGVAGLRGVPVPDLGLVDLPAEVDLAPVAQGGEVDEAGLEVADQQIHLLELLEPERRGDRGLRAGDARVGPADDVGERGEAAVEALVLQGALGVLEAADGGADDR